MLKLMIILVDQTAQANMCLYGSHISRVERKTSVSQMVVFPQT